MKRGDAFPSARLKAEDIKGHKVTVEIEDVKIERVGQGDDEKTKPVLYFRGKDKTLVLNVTNWSRIEDFLLSDDSDDWIGCRIVLGTERVDFQGKRVDAIRVIDGESKKAPRRGQPEPVQDESDAAEPFVADDEDVPF